MTTTLNSAPSKSIPFADDASIAKYDARWGSCTCPDYTIRGGSYRVDGQKVCKHMARQRGPSPLVGPKRVKAEQELAGIKTEQAPPAIEWMAFIELDPFAAFS